MKIKNKNFIVLIIVFLLNFLSGYSINNLENRPIKIEKSDILIDETGKIKFDEIILPKFSNKFINYESSAYNFGITKKHNWIRFKFSDVLNESSDKLTNKSLYFNSSIFGDLKVYIPIKGNKYEILYSNQLNATVGNSTQAIFPIFKLPDNIDTEVYTYIQVTSPYNNSFQIFLDLKEHLEIFQLRIILFFALLIGVLIAMLLYNSVLFTILNDKLYLSYLTYCFFLIIYEFTISGILRIIPFSYQEYFVRYIIVFALLTLAGYLHFVWNLLNVPKLSKVLTLIYYITWAICGISLILNIFNFVLLSNKITYLATGITSLLVIVSTIISIIKKNWIPKFYIFAIFMSMFSLCIYTLKAFAIIEYSLYVNYVLFASMTLEALFSSFALAEKIKKLQTDNEELKIKENQLFINKQIAEKSNKAKSEFLANMSHEIRTPLSGVLGFSDLLSKTPLTLVQIQYIKNINNSANTLLGLINNILDFSKIEAEKLELEYSNTDIIELVENSIDVIKYQAEKKGLELFLNIKPDVPKYAFIDPLRLNQILINLLGNAVKFTEIGKIELVLSFSKLDDEKGIFHFSVEDSGIGISNAQQSRIFNIFTQGDNSITRKFGGSGLGLVISNMLANKMNSSIKLKSTLGLGSTFYFSIETKYQRSDEINLTKNLKKVLIAINSKRRTQIIEEKFRYFDIDVNSVENKKELLDVLQKKNEYDLLIFEHDAPIKGEVKIIEIIRNDLKISKKALQIILIGDSEATSYLYNLSKLYDISSVLNKPIKSLELFYCIREIFHETQNNEKELKALESFSLNHKFRILIADDFEMNLVYIRDILERTLPNSDLVEVENGIEAVNEVKNRKFDLIFLDIQMPLMDGIEACQKIRKLEKESNIKTPIIALTADAVKDRSEKAIEAGINEYLTKPLKTSHINSILKKYLI